MAKRFSPRDQRRIASSVKWTERERSRFDLDRRVDTVRPTGLVPLLAKLVDDIEHRQQGNAVIADGTSWLNVDAGGDNLEIVNLFFPKLWKDSTVLLQRCIMRGVADREWLVTQAWSATRIRGVADAAISPGATGTISSVITIDGHFNSTTATVMLPTSHVTVGQGMATWAELVAVPELDVFGEETGNYVSEWHVYSADCQEAGG